MKQEGGFTLVEIIVTIVLVGITTASLTSLFISIRNIQQQSYLHNTAQRAAARQIESLRNNNYGTLINGQTIDFTNQLPTTLPNRSGNAVVTAPSTDLRRVDATVTYTSLGQTRTVTLSSMIGEIGITQ